MPVSGSGDGFVLYTLFHLSTGGVLLMGERRLGVIGVVIENPTAVQRELNDSVNGGINGSAALRIDRKTGGESTGWRLNKIFVSPDTDYELTGYFRSGNAAATKARAQILYRDTNGSILANHLTSYLGYSSSWKQFTLKSHSPTNAAYMEIRMITTSDVGQTLFFDGIRLTVPGLEGVYEFTGKREDEDTGLHYFAARWYDSDTCRFVTRDTVWGTPGVPGMLNLYAYCLNNPLGLVDPTGHYSAQSNIGQATAQHGESLSANPGNYNYSAQANIGQRTAESGEGFVSRAFSKYSESSKMGLLFTSLATADDGYATKATFTITAGSVQLGKTTLSLGHGCFGIVRALAEADKGLYLGKVRLDSVVNGLIKMVWGATWAKVGLIIAVGSEGVAAVIGIPIAMYGATQFSFGLAEFTLGFMGKSPLSEQIGVMPDNFMSISPLPN